MDKVNIEGVILTPLKQINHPLGNIYHGIKKSDPGYDGFGEAYFSTIKYEQIKGWKKHTKMTLNLIVPVGVIKFVLFDDRTNSKSFGNFYEIELSLENYFRLTIPCGIWVAFQGKNSENNILLNIANIVHNPDEAENLEINNDKFTGYEWK